MKKALWAAVLTSVAVVATGCAKNPVTGRNQLVLVSETQEIGMGKEYAEQVKQQMGLYKDPELQSLVESLGKKLAARSERPEIPWQFNIVDDPTVNAFALPGGPIFITRGMLAHMNSEAELAGVLGHEIGHITARHSVDQLTKAQFAQLGLGIGSIFAGQTVGALAGAGLQLLFMSHGRDDERQADQLGFQYVVENNYDPRAMTQMFETLTRVSQLAGAGGGGIPEWLSTHPNPENRVTANQTRINKANVDVTEATLNRESYLKLLEGMVYGQDPRQGFFKGSQFLHPELKFQLQFPDGWATQNSPAQVVAQSPQKDAVVGLLAAGKESPEALLQKFLSQQGIQAGQTSTAAVNGNPAASATFAAQTEQGAIEGVVTFLSYGGTTYAIMGQTAGGGLSKYTSAFQATTNSFNTLSDPAALSVQPARIELVKVPRDMSITEFHQQFPSTVDVKEIAVINGLEQGGTLKAGQLAKRVVGGVPTQS